MDDSNGAAIKEGGDVIKTEPQASGDDLPLDGKIEKSRETPPVNGSDELQDENDPELTIPKEEIQAKNSDIDDSHLVGSELDEDETATKSMEAQSILSKDDNKQDSTENLVVHSQNDREAPPLHSEVDKESSSVDINLEVSSKLIQTAEDAEIQPAEAAEIQSTGDAEIQPTKDTEMQPAEDTEIQPVKNAEVRPVEDSKIQPTENAEIRPAEDAEIQTTGNAGIQPVKNAEVKSVSEIQSAEKEETLPEDAAETSLVQPDKKLDNQCEDLENIKHPEKEIKIEPQDTLDTSTEESQLEQSEANVENQPGDEEMQDKSSIDAPDEDAQFVLPEVEDSTGPSIPEKTKVGSLDEDKELFDLSTISAPVGSQECINLDALQLSELDNDFEGFTNEKSNVLVIDFEKLNINKVEFDSVDIVHLQDDWWKQQSLRRSESVSSLETESTAPSPAPSSTSSHLSASPRNRNKPASRQSLPLTNAAFRKPFQYGFKREIVYRSTVDGGSNKRRLADIYYYTPENRKLRSSREIAEYLEDQHYNLTSGNFTFLKDPLGVNDPNLEIIREAKKKPEVNVLKRPSKSSPEAKSLKVPKLKISTKGRITTVPMESLMPRPTDLEANKQVPGAVKITPSSKPAVLVAKASSAVSKTSSVSKISNSPSAWGHAGSSQAFRQNLEAQYDGSSTKGLTPPCSIRCASAAGLIPSLQCSVCVCLYHPVCVGLTLANSENLHGYVCPNCRREKISMASKIGNDVPRLQQVPPPPALVPVMSLSGASSSSPNTPDMLPRLQRLPHPGESIPGMNAPMPMLQRLVRVPMPDAAVAGGKVLYSFGAWRPPLAPLQPAPAPVMRPPTDQSSPQSLALMNGKKYIVIPRNNSQPTLSVPSDSNDITDANKNLTPAPAPMTILGQPPIQLLPTVGSHLIGGSNPILPKGSILVNQPGMPGNPGGMFLMTPAEPQESLVQQQPQFMLVNTTGASPCVPVTSMIAATPSTSASVPKMAEEGASKQREVMRRAPPTGGFSFTEQLSASYQALLGVFRYLTVQELLRASQVCRVWRDVSEHRSLWSSIRMKNSRVQDWRGCISALKRHGSTHLDLRKTLLPKREEEAQAVWQEFCVALQGVAPSLRRLDLCRCPASVVARVAETCPYLEHLSATAITVKGDHLNLKSIGELHELRGLRLKSFHGMSLENFQLLNYISKVKQLSLTSVRLLPGCDVASALSYLTSLELLELGDCPGLVEQASLVAKALCQLRQLRRLRFEKLVSVSGAERDGVLHLLAAVASLPKLTHLELVNVEASPGCDEVIGSCINLRKLLIVPSYVTHGARTCQLILRGVLRLKDLEHFTWIVTNEVIGIIQSLVHTKRACILSPGDESEDCIPVLIPVPNISNYNMPVEEIAGDKKNLMKLDQLELLPMSRLNTTLCNGLPNTKVIVNKVTFQSTWRQTMSDWDFRKQE